MKPKTNAELSSPSAHLAPDDGVRDITLREHLAVARLGWFLMSLANPENETSAHRLGQYLAGVLLAYFPATWTAAVDGINVVADRYRK